MTGAEGLAAAPIGGVLTTDQPSTKMQFDVVSVRLSPRASEAHCKQATITLDTDLAGNAQAFNPAELLLAALSACMIKSIEGVTIMVVAGIGIVVNTATALLFMRGSKGDLNIRGAFLHMAADALVSAGVVVAGGLALWFGWTWLDPVVSLLIAAVIVVGTWSLFRQSLHLLFDGVPEGLDLQAVRALLTGLPGVAQVSDLHIWAMGTNETALTAHLVMPTGGGDDAFLAHATEELHEHFEIRHVTLQVTRAPLGNGCEPVAKTGGADDHGHDHDAHDHGHDAGHAHAPSGPKPAT